MDKGQIFKAFKDKSPVIFKFAGFESEYERISALIYRLDKNGKLDLSLELYDKCGHSTTTVSPQYITLKN